MSQTARRRMALLTDQLTGAAAAPSEATGGVPPTRAVLAQLVLLCGVPLLGLAALAALMWRASKQNRRRKAR
ncbi:hypothetical protein ACFYYB_34005 [Streptomyces sp. NPDC002886]|uniref:hypothetical protein n=1 Tax=Streptomyces sp. NPDC002886 TaxID=3364667 RepID=UPI003673F3CB